MKRRAAITAAILAVVPVQVAAAGIGGSPVYVGFARGEAGQGYLVKGVNGCVVVLPAHVMRDQVDANVTGTNGEQAIATLSYVDERADVALLSMTLSRPAFEACAPPPVKSEVDESIGDERLFALTRTPTGAVTRSEITPIRINDREMTFRFDGGPGVRRGMSGSPIVRNGRIVAFVVSGSGESRKSEEVTAVRADYVGRMFQNRLATAASPAETTARPFDAEGVTSDFCPVGTDCNQQLTESKPMADAPGSVRPLIWPVSGGTVVRQFGLDSFGARSDGVKIAVPSGTPIKAVEDGVVAYVGDGIAALGELVILRHGGGLTTVYGHASKLLVGRSQQVRRGDTIALSGDTGFAEMPELHFEVRAGRSPVDPLAWLPTR